MDRQAIQDRFGIIGESAAIRHVLDRLRQVARTDITLLLEGESGVGKELFAQAGHELSERRHKPLIVVNCGAIPEGLIESELFGNEKGAYTGASERRSGYFEQADGSTIFLDEIGEMPLAAQVRLLRVLESGTFSRVGSSVIQKTDVRIIAATNKDLAVEVQAGRFREDLYYRLSTVILNIPPLRDRREDILPIFERFLYRFSQKYNTPVKRLTESALQLLVRYRWPGNVRELRNVAEQAVVLLRSDTITAEQLQPFLRGVTAQGPEGHLIPLSRSGSKQDERERELVYRALLELRLEIREMKEQVRALVGTGDLGAPHLRRDHDERPYVIVRDREDDFAPASMIEEVPFEIEHMAKRLLTQGKPDEEKDEEMTGAIVLPTDGKAIPTLEEAEQKLILEALKHFEGNRRQAARALGISERTLYRKIKDMEEEVPSS